MTLKFSYIHFLVGVAIALVPITALLSAFSIVSLNGDLAATESKLKEAKQLAADKYRERDTCLKLNDELNAKLSSCQLKAAKASEEVPAKCVEYHELFNSFTAGVLSTNVVMYEMTDKELTRYCHTNWEVNIGKNYAGAKLVDHTTFEVSRSKSGSLFMVTCDWAIPSALWCNKKEK